MALPEVSVTYRILSYPTVDGHPDDSLHPDALCVDLIFVR